MLFDLALTLKKRAQIKAAVIAIALQEWSNLADMMRAGLSPNQRLPVSGLPNIRRQGPRYTTPFLAMSMHSFAHAAPNPLQEAFALALEKGADLSLRVKGDARGALEHQANLQSLGGWQTVCAARNVPASELLELARALGWPDGEAFALNELVRQQANALDQATPTIPERPRPRL